MNLRQDRPITERAERAMIAIIDELERRRQLRSCGTIVAADTTAADETTHEHTTERQPDIRARIDRRAS